MYHFNTSLQCGFDEAVARVTEALKAEGFGVLADIDVQATLKAKLDVDRLPYRILGARNPKLANQAISTEPDIGVLLPCNVVVRQEEDNSVSVSFMDPIAALSLVQRDEIKELATEVRSRLDRVSQAIS